MLTVIPQEYRLETRADADDYFGRLPPGTTIIVAGVRWMTVSTTPRLHCGQLVCLSGAGAGLVCPWADVFDSPNAPYVFSLGDCSA